MAVCLTAVILPGFRVKSFGGAFLVSAPFGVLNFFFGWIFFVVFAVGALGVAVLLAFVIRWIINAIVLKITDAFSEPLTIDSFGWALGGAAMMSLLGTLGEWVVRGVILGEGVPDPPCPSPSIQ